MQKGNRAIGENKAALTKEQRLHKQKMEALANYYKQSEATGQKPSEEGFMKALQESMRK